MRNRTRYRQLERVNENYRQFKRRIIYNTFRSRIGTDSRRKIDCTTVQYVIFALKMVLFLALGRLLLYGKLCQQSTFPKDEKYFVLIQDTDYSISNRVKRLVNVLFKKCRVNSRLSACIATNELRVFAHEMDDLSPLLRTQIEL